MQRNIVDNSVPILTVSALWKSVMLADGAQLDILKNICFEISAGETVAIVGASGSGKSTLLGLLAGLDVPTKGDVHLSGSSLFDADEDQRARMRGEKIGFVFQSFQLLPALTALENVMMPLELAARSNEREIAMRWLDRVGLSNRAHHYPKHLSGGEQQRVALARAFAMEPALLLADEPTGNLDAETGHHIIDLIFELNRESSTTLMLVTHDEELARACSRVIRLRSGEIV